MSNTYKSIKIKKEDYYTLRKLKDQFNCEFYEVVSKLIRIYDKLEVLQHYLGCESIDQLFEELEQLIPKSKKQLIVAKTNRYLEELEKLDVPKPILDKLSDMIYPVILNGGVHR